MADNLQKDIKNLNLRLRKILSSVEGQEKKEITTRAGLIVALKARQLSPVGKARGGVLKGAASATYKSGKLSARYYPLNLKRSLQVLKLRKTTATIVGPVIANKETRKNYGKTRKTVSAFYAQMIFGSALAFQRRITQTALISTQAKVVNTIKKDVLRRIKSEAKKQKLD